MNMTHTKIISAIIECENNLESIVNELEQSLVARHELSIQSSASQIAARFGKEYVNPEIIQKTAHPPMKEPFLSDDFGFVVALAFAVPVVVGAMTGLILMDISALKHYELFYVLTGALLGAVAGFISSNIIKKRHERAIKAQEKAGGFVLWIAASSDERTKEIISILKHHHAKHIITRESF